MASHAEGYVLASERREFHVPKAGLDANLEEGPISTADPGIRVWSRQDRGHLALIQEGNHAVLVTLCRDRENLLAL
jgi:hypothetical protein